MKQQKITTILFDLDGTLLPMDNAAFTKGYFKLLAARLAPLGYEPEKLVDAVWSGTAAMVKNDGSQNNEAAFWKRFSEIYGEKVLDDLPVFENFYATDFQQAKAMCGFNPKAAEAVRTARDLGLRVALATNPIFPAIATESRIRWAGLQPEDFELYTTYENIGYCKPNPAYYQELLDQLNESPERCLMVGNDVAEDMIAEKLGMQVFLLTDCIINKEEADVSVYPRGGFDELLEHIRTLA
ncbi:MAG TPA: HAD family hydrolase [Candidatus Merdisoma merdipullorum]|nr:HAD family hydrolase [Candidatus Merdisoma merdipullorum]